VEFASVVDAVTRAVAVQAKMAERNQVTEPKITFRIWSRDQDQDANFRFFYQGQASLSVS
jgi:hypothetical protein